MSEPASAAYALLESSFVASPDLRAHKPLQRKADDHRSFEPAAAKQETLWMDDETDSQASSQRRTTSPLASPPPTSSGAESGLPPTPPSNSQDGLPTADYSPPSHADSVVTSLASRKSTLSTPVNQRSPPTPDPSPPRRATTTMTTPERPGPVTYPSSRAESFTTAREEPISSEADSRSSTPLGHQLSVVQEDRGLGLAFEREDEDATPRNTFVGAPFEDEAKGNESGPDAQDHPDIDNIPNREWDTNLMRNVTVRKRRNTKPSPQKTQNKDVPRAASPAASPVARSTPRRSSSLRERVEASRHSPHTASIENFAKSINWPVKALEGQASDSDQKRFSTSSMSSTVVEAMVLVTPPKPQRRHTLRHSGKNLAYRREEEPHGEHGAVIYSRSSMRSDSAPLHRLVHKRDSINTRVTLIDSASMYDRTATPASLRQRAEESAAVTLAHQRSVKSVLQPAADIMSRSNSVTRNSASRNSHKRIASAPEAAVWARAPSLSRSTFEISPPDSPSPRRQRKASSKLAHVESASPPSPVRTGDLLLPRLSPSKSPTRTRVTQRTMADVNKSLPVIPLDPAPPHTNAEDADDVHDTDGQDARPASAMLDRVRHLLASSETEQPMAVGSPHVQESPGLPPAKDFTSAAPRGSITTRGGSEEGRPSPLSRDSTNSRDAVPRPSLDRIHTDEHSRSSRERHSFHTDENGRISFDRSTIRTDEHAMARHLFSQNTPFSQFSDTPIEVSEATAVSIYPHNNNSLLVVQQVSRTSQQPQEFQQVVNAAHHTPRKVGELEELSSPISPTFFDADEGPQNRLQQPTLTFEPSTPPMQIDLPTFTTVDSPLKNPRKPPMPPVIKFIPPTPAEELERELAPGPPGPPRQSDSLPQRRLSLKQRARRYSDNLISPFLARATSRRGQAADDSHGHGQVHVPSVNDETGTLHPFWRPRGFWDDFEDSDPESDDDMLPRGGDTSDVDDSDSEAPSPRNKVGALSRRLTNRVKKPTGFLIGNSLGVERSGTNRRRPQITLPSHSSPSRWSKRDAPKILIQPPTLPSYRRAHMARVQKRDRVPSSSVASSSTRSAYTSTPERERPRRRSDRGTWRQGKSIPGLRNMQVQYIGLSGVRERFREKRAERRREALRKSIGGRWYVEHGSGGSGGSHLHT